MSGSFPTFDHVVAPLLAQLQPRRALDLGAGSGKYGRLLRDAAPDCERVAVEVDPHTVQQHDLAALYHQVHVADATAWCAQQPACFDVVLLGDCLTQLPKSQGLDLLNALLYRSAWLVVLSAEFVVQPGAVGPQRSVWSERDLHWHDLYAWDNTRTTTLALLRGYQPSPLTMDQVVRLTNEARWPLLDFDGQTVVRPCRLRLVDQAREVAYRVR
ncbi:MAG: class I SAM-dependent methyltransferase [Rubrivivax sp.]